MWSHKGVYRVELYAAVRRAVYVEGISEREASKRFGLARKTVHKMLGYAAPPGYQRNRPVKRPKLEAFLGVIDQILALPALSAASRTIPARRVSLRHRFSRARQKILFCACGEALPAIAGFCLKCYRARAHSRRYFDGHRDTVLARDGGRCRCCGAGKQDGSRLPVHHRSPGVHREELLVTLCAACHARVHRRLRQRSWLPEPLVELWCEQHPTVPLQLQFPLSILGAELRLAA